jgi:16S rRNA (adenine1518-N6/adenine1519-N6)-dimethyltransferase
MPKPRKRFGQNFLHDEGIIHQIVNAVSPHKKDVIIEIGPGKGALTYPLLALHSHLIAIEIDRDLINSLKRTATYYPDFQLIQADVLEFDFSSLPGNLKIVGNLPYNISTPLLFHLLKFKGQISEMIFMLQKEMVDRICAEPNTPDYGRLSVMLQHDFDAECLFEVPNAAFMPAPKVESAVVRLIPKVAAPILDYAVFSDIVREAFQYRRKTLRHALGKYFTETLLEKAGISSKARPGELTVQNFEALSNCLVTEHKYV